MKTKDNQVRFAILAPDRKKVVEAKDVAKHLKKAVRLLEAQCPEQKIIVVLDSLDIISPDFSFVLSTYELKGLAPEA